MVIAGFQSLSLIDYPGKSCSIVFTQGCPFRCPYCHNPELISTRPTTTVSEESVFAYLEKHKKMLDGVCITGGEPTIQVGLRAFIERVKNLGLLVKLDTNGVHPEFMRAIFADKLVDFVAMDLKHRWGRYHDVIRAGGEKVVENCRETFGIIQESGVDHEFRSTIAPALHNEEDIIEMASYLKPGERYALQEIRYQKTLDPELAHGEPMDLAQVAERLRLRYPSLKLELRK